MNERHYRDLSRSGDMSKYAAPIPSKTPAWDAVKNPGGPTVAVTIQKELPDPSGHPANPPWDAHAGLAKAILDAKQAFRERYGEPYKRVFRLKVHRPRPHCACCGKRYGSRWTERKDTLIHEPPEPYSGNACLVMEELRDWGSGRGGPVPAMLVRETWDGETYTTPYQPFCTLRCALTFARSAHDAGWRPEKQQRLGRQEP